MPAMEAQTMGETFPARGTWIEIRSIWSEAKAS